MEQTQQHRMIGSFDENSQPIWMCPICGHTLAFPSGKPKVISRGDFNASHFGFVAKKYSEVSEATITMEQRFAPPIDESKPAGWYEPHEPSPTTGTC